MQVLRAFPLLLGTLLLAAGLAAGCGVPAPQASDVTVEGTVTARGNAPFSTYVLETDQRNAYVLNLEDVDRQGFTSPARVRVVGSVYLDEWNGRRFAHLRVRRWEAVGR